MDTLPITDFFGTVLLVIPAGSELTSSVLETIFDQIDPSIAMTDDLEKHFDVEQHEVQKYLS